MTEKEYNQCVTTYADNVYRFIVKNLRHEEDARDVVQTAFEKMWRNREAIDAEKSKSYLFTVAYNQMIDRIVQKSMYGYRLRSCAIHFYGTIACVAVSGACTDGTCNPHSSMVENEAESQARTYY